jgi:hypothetical protein
MRILAFEKISSIKDHVGDANIDNLLPASWIGKADQIPLNPAPREYQAPLRNSAPLYRFIVFPVNILALVHGRMPVPWLSGKHPRGTPAPTLAATLQYYVKQSVLPSWNRPQAPIADGSPHEGVLAGRAEREAEDLKLAAALPYEGPQLC